MNILTFDLEEWIIYTYYDKGGKDYFLPILDKNLGYLLDLLDKYNQKATFFCLGQLAKEYPDVVNRILRRGHDLGCHSNTHQLITTMNPDSFLQDTQTALKRLEDVCGKKITSYRAPAFSITEQNKWAFEILVELGIVYDSSLFPVSRSFGGFPTLSASQPFVLNFKQKELKEFPVYVKKTGWTSLAFSGGGYFRLIPYPLIKKWTSESPYTMTYFHIRDFDKEQKVVYSLRYFKSYYGIKHAFEKLQKYLSDFQFFTLEQADQKMDWGSAPMLAL